MDRMRWARSFNLAEGAHAPWPCPECGQAALKVAAGTVHVEEGQASRAAVDHPAWEPEWIDRRFTCFLACTCGEYVAVTGQQSVAQVLEGTATSFRLEYANTSEPLFFYPSLAVIDIPAAVPVDVREQLESSFRSLWSDVEASANRVRSSIEKLLDYRGVRRTVINKKNKRVSLSLHNRIELFGKSGQPHAQELMAAKWLGNAGSHASGITREDLLDAYEIMEHVLREMFDPPAKKMAKIAKEINRAKRPRSAVSHKRKRRQGISQT